ncbi:bifunctional adenosylcobinamide kinase/adenosylcobinamide-phosphate guanylyltransferase [Polycladidibacter stylochi]|uniref:bifunctional adenosylcobinamide kinase/adenosylcobinamide-phosphate guanylyltransferase n=1 Tax=Polycladidibacter stylochi TaxID=1807766 RepID=UPI000832FE01|nr:bifunctional adenosylcobinamide kinase/adenosylcobinamide-phosphate guanylyltransferase [Pseudovibrio stylochi]
MSLPNKGALGDVRTVFIVGGARSGKSAYGEQLVLKSGLEPVYIATGQAYDEEMRERIQLHQLRRGIPWRTVEEPLALPEAIAAHSTANSCILIDCLTLWLSNLMHHEHDLIAGGEALCVALAKAQGPVVVVSNEVGLGIVPENKLARQFRDNAGRLNQSVAAQCERVLFMASGLPLPLKPSLVSEFSL